MPGNLAGVLREQAPHGLQEEVTERRGVGRSAVLQLLVEVDEMNHCLAGECRLATREDGLVRGAGKEQQRVVLIGKVDQVEHETRLLRVRARLPDLHAAERADDDEARRRNTDVGVRGLDPVSERLLAVLCQPLRFAWRLHLDQADARPDEVEEASSLGLLEASDVRPARAVAVEQLVEERLCLGALATVVHAPTSGKRGEPRPDLLAGRGHSYVRLSWSLGTWKYVPLKKTSIVVSSSRSACSSASTRCGSAPARDRSRAARSPDGGFPTSGREPAQPRPCAPRSPDRV